MAGSVVSDTEVRASSGTFFLTLAYFSNSSATDRVSAVMASGSPSSSSSSVAVASKKASLSTKILDDHRARGLPPAPSRCRRAVSEAAAHWPARHAGRCRHGWGSSTAGSSWLDRRICLSSCITSSRARTDFSRPTKKRHDHVGKNHDVAQRQNRIGDVALWHFALPRCLGRKPRTPVHTAAARASPYGP